jgi:hypothetical protein
MIGAVALFAFGPYDIKLLSTPKAPEAKGTARLVFAESPFVVSVTEDGRSSYDVQLNLTGLPQPSTIGAYKAYIAWAATTDLKKWHRLGPVHNGSSTVGRAEDNKFLLVITAESDSSVREHNGPTVLHGISPSAWLQSFVTHPLFRGISQ